MVMYLCSQDCSETGNIFNSGMGYFSRAAICTGRATKLGTPDNPLTPEQIHANWKKINSMEGAREIEDAHAAILALIEGSDEEIQT